MKKAFKSLSFAILMTLLLSLSLILIGCSENTPTTPEEILKKAQDNLASLKSYDADLTMQMTNLNMLGQSLNMNMDATMTYFVDPIKAKIQSTIDMPALGQTQNVDYYIVEEDNAIKTYIYANDQWSSENLAIDDLGQYKQYNAQANMDLYLKSAQNFTQAGTEKIDDHETLHFQGVMKGENLKETLLASGALDSLSGSGVDAAMLESMMNDLGDLPVEIWVQTDTYTPVRYTMDMTEMYQKLMNSAIEQIVGLDENTQGQDLSVSLNKAVLTMTLYHINQASDFEVPSEALSAAL